MRRQRISYWPAILTVAVTVALTALFGSLYVSGVAQSAKDDFHALTSLTSQIFAESIRAEMSEDQLQNITQSFVRGDVLYAQIVVNGEVIFEDRIDAASSLALDRSDFTGSFRQQERTLQSGVPYLDIMRPILGGAGNFIRIGFSMREIENRVLSETLFVMQIGLGAVIVVALISGFFVWILNRQNSLDSESATNEDQEMAGVFGAQTQPRASMEVSAQAENSHRVLEAGPLLIDYTSKVVSLNGEAIELSPKEFDLVTLLATNPGKVFSNDEILESVWADGFSATSKDVKQYIYLLRRKLEPDPESPSLIVTVRGFGYKLETGQNGQT